MNGSERMPEGSPAEELREAARLMRERANIASSSPWGYGGRFFWKLGSSRGLADGWWHAVQNDDGDICVMGEGDAPGAEEATGADAEHIASWHPAVALAVADWLEHQARAMEVNVEEGARPPGCHPTHPAIALARAYLGAAS